VTAILRRDHWDRVYTSKGENDVSWFEPFPDLSLAVLDAAGLTSDACIVDIGGGASRLIDELIRRGLTCLAVLDVSLAALERTQTRLGDAARIPIWIAADVTDNWTLKPMDVWHDRAVFHFLTAPGDRARYVHHLKQTVKVGGTTIIATFAPDGPEKCSGLPVMRYSPESLARELGDEFSLVQALPHVHQTPWGATQSFQYSRFVRVAL
jgi:trans-aconitate methyltransferase